MGDDEDARTLFVGNLSAETSEEILFELFLQAGPLCSVKKVFDKQTKKHKSFAFVSYKHECSVPYALYMFDGIMLNDRPLKVQSRRIVKITPTVHEVGVHSLNSASLSKQVTPSHSQHPRTQHKRSARQRSPLRFYTHPHQQAIHTGTSLHTNEINLLKNNMESVHQNVYNNSYNSYHDYSPRNLEYNDRRNDRYSRSDDYYPAVERRIMSRLSRDSPYSHNNETPNRYYQASRNHQIYSPYQRSMNDSFPNYDQSSSSNRGGSSYERYSDSPNNSRNSSHGYSQNERSHRRTDSRNESYQRHNDVRRDSNRDRDYSHMGKPYDYDRSYGYGY